MNNRSLVITLFIFSISLFMTLNCSQENHSNFNGIWVGKMIQPEGPRGEEGYTQYFQFQVNGSSVKGMSRIEVPESNYFGEMTISGNIKNDSLFFKEDSIIVQHAREGHWWCRKNGFLVLDSTKLNLSGKWISSDCVPGRFELHRIFQK